MRARDIVKLSTRAQFHNAARATVPGITGSPGATPVHNSRSATQLGAASTLDQGMRDAIARFRFPAPLEQQFRDAHLEQNLPRARSATAIYFALVLVVTAIQMFGGAAPPPDLNVAPVYFLRLGVACPALVMILVASYWRPLHRHYQWIASTCVTVTGLSVMTISALAASGGFPQFQMGDVLVLVYATLFLGLLFRVVAAVAVALCVGFIGIG